MTGEFKGKTDNDLKEERKKTKDALDALDMEIAMRDKARRDEARAYIHDVERGMRQKLAHIETLRTRIQNGDFFVTDKHELNYFIETGNWSK